MLLCTFLYKSLCGHVFSFLLGLYLGVELLAHMVTLCKTNVFLNLYSALLKDMKGDKFITPITVYLKPFFLLPYSF